MRQKKHHKQSAKNNFELKSQYLKDCSFENPNAPQCFSITEQPRIGISINLNATHFNQSNYEVTLHLEAHAELEADSSLFLASVDYCGIFEVSPDIKEEQLQEILLVDGPSLLFPYARHIISDMTREGGFPALNLSNVNFKELYAEKKAQGLVDIVGAPAINSDLSEEKQVVN